MDNPVQSPRIAHLSWGRVEVEEHGFFKDVQLYPGGCRDWNWKATGTQHTPGIQPADIEVLLKHGATVVVLSQGMYGRLQVYQETLQILRERDILVHVLQTKAAVRLYNKLRETEPVGGLIHSTC